MIDILSLQLKEISLRMLSEVNYYKLLLNLFLMNDFFSLKDCSLIHSNFNLNALDFNFSKLNLNGNSLNTNGKKVLDSNFDPTLDQPQMTESGTISVDTCSQNSESSSKN